MVKDWIRASASQRTELYLSLATLACAMLLFLANPDNAFPIDYGDETTYLEGARSGGITLAWSPPYAAWYRLLSMFVPDPITLFYANSTLLTSALSFLVFAFLIRFDVRPYIALLGAMWMLLWAFNAGTSVKVNHFNLILLLLGFLIADKLGSTLGKKILLLGTLALFLTYVRQENLFIACLSFQVFLGLYSMRPRRPDRFLVTCTLATVAGVTLLVMFSPIGRGWVAFEDHYYSLYELHAPRDRPLERQDIVIPTVFPGARSTLEALQVNPVAVLRAFGTRLSDIGTTIVPIIAYHFSVLNPVNRLSEAFIYLECGLAVLALTIVFFLKNGNAAAFLNKHRFLSVFLLLLAGKLVISCIFVNPVLRYLMDFIVVLMIFAIAFLASGWRKQLPLAVMLPALLALLILTPRSTQITLNDIILPPENRKFREARAAIEHIRQENKKRGLDRPRYFAGNIFPVFTNLKNSEYTNHGLLSSVSGDRADDNYKTKFARALAKANVNVVVIDEKLLYEVAIGHNWPLEPIVRNFPNQDECFETTLKNSFATVLYRKPECGANGGP